MKTLKTLKLVIPAFLVVGALAGCARDWHESVTSAQLTHNATKLNAEVKWCQQKQSQGQDVRDVAGCVAATHVLRAEVKNAGQKYLTAKPLKSPF
ncbi:MAG: hypothetical protein ACYCT1_13560 [Steroidobacteraceae bacterium]